MLLQEVTKHLTLSRYLPKWGNKKIPLVVASSGIAATLLSERRTAHTTFKLPLHIASNDAPVCNISKTSGMGQILKKCYLIIRDGQKNVFGSSE